MDKITKHIICELTGYKPGTVDVSQGDRRSRAVSCRLMENGTPWMIPDGSVARIAYTLPDGTEGLYDRRPDGTPMWEISGNIVTVILADQIMAQAGMAQMSILIIGPEGGQLATWPIRVMVTANKAARLTTPESMPPYGDGFVGNLFFGGEGGAVTPLTPGRGLDIVQQADGSYILVVQGGVASTEYVDAELAKVWEEIHYTPIKISNFRRTPTTVALGTVLDSVTVAWTLNKEPTTQKLNGTILVSSARSVDYPGPFAETTELTLTVTDERAAADTVSAKVYFYNHVYYGVRAGREMPLNAELHGMPSSLQDSLGLTINANAGAGEYVLYACPSRLGTPEFWANGFQGGFEKLGTMVHTNAAGYMENYDVWLSNAAGLNITITVK